MSTENLFPFNEPKSDITRLVSSTECSKILDDKLIKLDKRGRKSHTNIPVDDQYFNVYYHLTKTEIVCECGIKILTKSMARHLNRKIHQKKLKKLQKLQNVD